MTEDKREAILRKVRGLLAKANATPFEGEAEVFRAKADELMTIYAIETWQLAQEDPTTKQMPIRKDLDLTWYYDDEVGEELWSMFLALVSHCRCVVANKNVQGGWDPETGTRTYSIPVFGTESDVFYLNMVFTDLYVQFSGKLKPTFDPTKSRAENIYVAKEAGMSWKDIASWIGEPELVKYKPNGDVASISGSLKRDYRAWAEATQTSYHTSNPRSYKRSFAIGFTQGVKEQLRKMAGDQGQNTGSMALAIRDIREDARAAMFEMFPNQAQRSRSLGRADTRKLDTSGLARGNSEGSKARIAGKGDNTLRSAKQLKK